MVSDTLSLFRCLLRVMLKQSAVVPFVRTGGPDAKRLHRMPPTANQQRLYTRQSGPQV